MPLRCPACAGEVNEYMGWCPACGEELDAASSLAPSTSPAPAAGRRWVLPGAAGAILIAVAAAVVASILGGSGHRPPAPVTPATVPSGSDAVAVADPLARPSATTGAVLVGVRQNRIVAVRVDDGTAESIRVPGGADISSVVADGRWVLVLEGAPNVDGPVWAFSPDALVGRAGPEELGSGILALPTASGPVWVVSNTGGGYSADEVTLDGRVLAPGRPLPGVVPIGVVGSAFLVESQGRLALWDPASGTFGRDIGAGTGPVNLGVAGTRVAWWNHLCSCVHVSDTATGTTVTVPLRSGDLGSSGEEAAVSSDGDHLALGLAGQIGVVDVSRRAVSYLPAAGPPVALAWSPDGAWLFASDGDTLTLRRGGVASPQPLGPFLPWAVAAA